LREELEKLYARPVDIVTPPGLANPYFRQCVEQEKTLLYAA
jgi:predicted nucleotidyltransferase